MNRRLNQREQLPSGKYRLTPFLLCGLGIFGFCLFTLLIYQSTPPSRDAIRVVYQPDSRSLDFLVAMECGFFKERGIELELTEVPAENAEGHSMWQVAQGELLAGEYDLAAGCPAGIAYETIAKDLMNWLWLDAGVETANGAPLSVVYVKCASNIDGIDELAQRLESGRARVAVLDGLWAKECQSLWQLPPGVTPEILLSGTDDWFANARADVVVGDTMDLASLDEDQRFRRLETNIRARRLGAPYWHSAHLVRRSFAEDNPAALVAFKGALDQARAFIRANRQESYELLKLHRRDPDLHRSDWGVPTWVEGEEAQRAVMCWATRQGAPHTTSLALAQWLPHSPTQTGLPQARINPDSPSELRSAASVVTNQQDEFQRRMPGGPPPGGSTDLNQGSKSPGSESTSTSSRKADGTLLFPSSPREELTQGSAVGGVSLAGARLIPDLGPVIGIARDNGGRLVLITEDNEKAKLPPLKLDDLVTIFRCVYSGQYPYVSIDPDPNDPEGPEMVLRHDPGTRDTYPGWVLFETDRVMKGYFTGFDNITGDPTVSKVRDYQRILDRQFLQKPHTSIMERFWIVPARFARKPSSTQDVTLLDVPLTVRTRVIELGPDNKPRDVKGAAPSQFATGFTTWFTENYDRINEEVRSVPPGEKDTTNGVPIYAELRRLALMTAIADLLREKGVELPPWMGSYNVESLDFPKRTKAIRGKQHVRTRRTGLGIETATVTVSGGVSLSPSEGEGIRTLLPSAEEEKLMAQVLVAIAGAQDLVPKPMKLNGKDYRLLALPEKSLGLPGSQRCQLEEIDLVVPLDPQGALRLVRHYDSSQESADVLGSGWSLDLPRLIGPSADERKREGHKGYRIQFVIRSNLDFECPSVAVKDIADDMRIKASTRRVALPNGAFWHFDRTTGNLVAMEEGKLAVVYRRDKKGRVETIEGWFENEKKAAIVLGYNAEGRLAAANAGKDLVVCFRYDGQGMLIGVDCPGGLSYGYGYENNLLAKVMLNGKTLRTFGYVGGALMWERNSKGQLISLTQTPGLVRQVDKAFTLQRVPLTSFPPDDKLSTLLREKY